MLNTPSYLNQGLLQRASLPVLLLLLPLLVLPLLLLAWVPRVVQKPVGCH
jgi:hypothetical protein